ncbi:MAG: trypsin-like peptidase domain-containing protein [Pseudomonadales bacterium]
MSQLTRFIMLPALIGALLGIGIILFNTLSNSKPGFASAVAVAAPAVVNIHTRTVQQANPICRFYKQLCQRFGNNAQIKRSLGSGVILQSDGHILTNEHVVKGAHEILVMFANGQIANASVIGSDPHTDLAVIKVTAENLPVVPLAEADAEVGDIALAIGNPFGLGHSVSQGIISAFSRAAITDDRPYDDFIQTDAAISPGNSGGALVDYRGRLLGINTMIVSQSGGSEGIGFAIPTDIATDVLAQIIAQGRVIRGWLGVVLGPNFDNLEVGGLRVGRVTNGGPAHLAGIRPGDVLLSINQVQAIVPAEITDVIAKATPGSELQIEVLRGTQRFRATAITGELPDLP